MDYRIALTIVLIISLLHSPRQVVSDTLLKCITLTSSHDTVWLTCPGHHDISIERELIGVKTNASQVDCYYGLSYSHQDCIGPGPHQTDVARHFCNAAPSCPRYYATADMPSCASPYINGQVYVYLEYTCRPRKASDGSNILSIAPFVNKVYENITQVNIKTLGYPFSWHAFLNMNCTLSVPPDTDVKIDILDMSHNSTDEAVYCMNVKEKTICASPGIFPRTWNVPYAAKNVTIAFMATQPKPHLGARLWLHIKAVDSEFQDIIKPMNISCVSSKSSTASTTTASTITTSATPTSTTSQTSTVKRTSTSQPTTLSISEIDHRTIPDGNTADCIHTKSSYDTLWINCPPHHEIAIYQEIIGIKPETSETDCSHVDYSEGDCVGGPYIQSDISRVFCNGFITCPRYYTSHDLPKCGEAFTKGQSYARVQYTCVDKTDAFGDTINTIDPLQNTAVFRASSVHLRTVGYPTKQRSSFNSTCTVSVQTGSAININILDFAHNDSNSQPYCIRMGRGRTCSQPGYWPELWTFKELQGGRVDIQFIAENKATVNSRIWIAISVVNPRLGVSSKEMTVTCHPQPAGVSTAYNTTTSSSPLISSSIVSTASSLSATSSVSIPKSTSPLSSTPSTPSKPPSTHSSTGKSSIMVSSPSTTVLTTTTPSKAIPTSSSTSSSTSPSTSSSTSLSTSSSTSSPTTPSTTSSTISSTTLSTTPSTTSSTPPSIISSATPSTPTTRSTTTSKTSSTTRTPSPSTAESIHSNQTLSTSPTSKTTTINNQTSIITPMDDDRILIVVAVCSTVAAYSLIVCIIVCLVRFCRRRRRKPVPQRPSIRHHSDYDYIDASMIPSRASSLQTTRNAQPSSLPPIPQSEDSISHYSGSSGYSSYSHGIDGISPEVPSKIFMERQYSNDPDFAITGREYTNEDAGVSTFRRQISQDPSVISGQLGGLKPMENLELQDQYVNDNGRTKSRSLHASMESGLEYVNDSQTIPSNFRSVKSLVEAFQMVDMGGNLPSVPTEAGLPYKETACEYLEPVPHYAKVDKSRMKRSRSVEELNSLDVRDSARRDLTRDLDTHSVDLSMMATTSSEYFNVSRQDSRDNVNPNHTYGNRDDSENMEDIIDRIFDIPDLNEYSNDSLLQSIIINSTHSQGDTNKTKYPENGVSNKEHKDGKFVKYPENDYINLKGNVYCNVHNYENVKGNFLPPPTQTIARKRAEKSNTDMTQAPSSDVSSMSSAETSYEGSHTCTCHIPAKRKSLVMIDGPTYSDTDA